MRKPYPGPRAGNIPRADGHKANDVFHGTIGELFPENSRGKPQELANEDPGWLCWAEKSGEPPSEKAYRKRQGLFDFMEKLFHADAARLKELSKLSIQSSCLSGVVETENSERPPGSETEDPPERNEDVGYLIGLDAVTQLERCVNTAKALLEEKAFRFLSNQLGGKAFDTAKALERLDQLLAEKRREEEKRLKENPASPSAFRFQDWKRSGQEKDNIRVELFVLFHCDGGSEFTASLLKARLVLKGGYLHRLHSADKRRYVEFVEEFGLCGEEEGQEPPDKVEKARKAASKPGYKPSVSSFAKTDFISRLRKELGYIFPSFTAIRGFAADGGDPAKSNGACKLGYLGWKKLDYAAYEEAIKSPHQIRQKQKERDNEAKKLGELKKLYEGKGREKGKADDGEDEDFIPGGFSEPGGDPRFAAMKRVHEALAVTDGADPAKVYRYGISQAALRGYEELREAWNKVGSDDDSTDEKSAALKECLKAHLRQHFDDKGDSRLFEELIKKDNWCVWQAAKPEVEAERNANRYSTNIVRDYLRYCDVLDELEKKTRPIQYTPADARESRRLFDFKGASQGGFEHLASTQGLSFTTQIAVRWSHAPGDLYRRQEVRIHYTAPRLLRDEARALGESEDLKSANWAQPLMRALEMPENDRHNFQKHAVALMPDWEPGSQLPEPDRLLVNFVLTPKEDKFIAHLRKQMGHEKWPWTMQFNRNGDGHDSTLRWPHEDWSKIKGREDFPGTWFGSSNMTSFRLLSIDLGQKQAGAYALIEVSCCLPVQEKRKARFIGKTEHNGEQRAWHARVLATGLLRLPGEDATVFRPEYQGRKPVPGSKAFREELSGSAGRDASKPESQVTLALLKKLHQLELVDEDARDPHSLSKQISFPDQNVKLLIAFRRAQSFASKLHRWCWFLDPQEDIERKDQAVRRRTAIREMAEADEHEWLDKAAHAIAKARERQLGDAKTEPELHPEIVGALKRQLQSIMRQLPCWLAVIANRVYPSRRGKLVWRNHPDREGCHLLDFTLRSVTERRRLTKERARLAGQRGLSMERIEQLEELRKRCQSLNQMLRRKIGKKPPLSRDESIPDPCPTLLAKLDEIKEQRRNQTAHMILTQALGLTVAEPAEPQNAAEAEMREAKDAHGEYVKADLKGQPASAEKGNMWRGVVDFIVIEDLSRYRTSQGRAPRENSRLMKWCHRAVRDKLKQMCEPFGLPLVETPAAYSSRFCSRTGVAGFRATELTADPSKEARWRWRIRKPEEGKEETKEQIKRREQWELLFERVRDANNNRNGNTQGQQWRTLLAPDAGGSIFIPISKLRAGYKRQTKDEPIVQFELVTLEENQCKQPKLIHADINAAVNLGLRAVADPRLWTVHSRLRSEREFGTPLNTKPTQAKGKKRTNEVTQTPAEEIEPDKFWVSEKEKRRFGERTDENRAQIRISVVETTLKEAERATDLSEKRSLRRKAAASVPKASESRHPNFFNDVAGLQGTHWGAASLDNLPANLPKPVHLVSGKALWGYVKEQAWQHCMKINAARLGAWNLDPPKNWAT